MHSYEIAFDGWFVPADNLIGGEDGLGPRLLLPDGGLRERPAADRGPGRRRDAGRLRGGPPVRRATASVFGQPVGDYQLTQAKLGRMAVVIQAARQFAYAVARLMAKGEGAARGLDGQGLRLQGGRVGHPRGHADPRRLRATPRSTRSAGYFVDARVLSIFEGADETLCLKVIARRLVDNVRSRRLARRFGARMGR